MPKSIELTIEIEIQKVSCPGVWLCQDGRVSLTVFALGTSYQTCLLPPVFPLTFRDVFYFRKFFTETCALNSICCMLKDETIYCELVQWCDNCESQECVLLAQYLGAINDVLFPPNMCSTDGVDLLMRRTTDFPGILSPKIEIATKVRINEIWNQNPHFHKSSKVKACQCNARRDVDGGRQRQVCHSPQYHRSKCNQSRPRKSHRSRSRSDGSRSCLSLNKEEGCPYTNLVRKSRASSTACPPAARCARARQYDVYPLEVAGLALAKEHSDDSDDDARNDMEIAEPPKETRLQRLLLESRYIEQDKSRNETPRLSKKCIKVAPCVCEICRKYHEIFHANDANSKSLS